jgi:hypothetical protein
MKYFILVVIAGFISCKEQNPDKTYQKTITKRSCSIEEQASEYVNKIFMDSIVKLKVQRWNSVGLNNIKIKSDLLIPVKKIKIDTFYVTLSDSLTTKRDLILTIEKINCKKGEFNFTTVYKSFSLDGEIKKTKESWDVDITANVTIN